MFPLENLVNTVVISLTSVQFPATPPQFIKTCGESKANY